jgi:aspartate kinase
MTRPIVMKFGGTSVADATRLGGVAELARTRAADGVLVVLSALSKVTDALFACGRAAMDGDEGQALAGLDELLARHEKVASELFGGPPPPVVLAALDTARAELGALLRGVSLLGTMPAQSLDLLAGRGEILSSTILAAFMGEPWIDARTVLRTDSRFGQARPQVAEIRELARKRLWPLVQPGRIAVTQGYIGSDAAGLPTTLGRGGSDYSASLFGAAIDAAEIQI